MMMEIRIVVFLRILLFLLLGRVVTATTPFLSTTVIDWNCRRTLVRR